MWSPRSADRNTFKNENNLTSNDCIRWDEYTSIVIIIILLNLQWLSNSMDVWLLWPSIINIRYAPVERFFIYVLKCLIQSKSILLLVHLLAVNLITQSSEKPESIIQLKKWYVPLIIIKGEIYQPNVLIHSIIVAHSRLLNYIDLAFLYLFKRIITIKAVIILIIKPVSSKL